MNPYLKNLLFWSLFLCLAPAVVLAQANACPDVVKTALQSADVLCAQTGRNQACYGNILIHATSQPDAPEFRFETTGDLVDVSDIQSLSLSPMNTDTGDWGVAIMKLQANLPETLPGQNVTFLLFGDVQIVNAVTPDNPDSLSPMQAFYLKTGVSDAQCAEAPESGMLVQTPQGSKKVAFNVNGVDVQMGSTVFFQAQASKEMTVSTLEGAAYISAASKTEVIVPGTWASVPLEPIPQNDTSTGGSPSAPFIPLPVFPAEIMNMIIGLLPTGQPEDPRSYDGRIDNLLSLPVDLLERDIEIAEPLTDEEVAEINDLIDQGVLCGQEPLPVCEDEDSVEGTDETLATDVSEVGEEATDTTEEALSSVPKVTDVPEVPDVPTAPDLPDDNNDDESGGGGILPGG